MPMLDSAQWICAPDALLARCDRPKCADFPDAPFLYAHKYIRQHLRRLFEVTEAPSRAWLHLQCDNAFDLFLNGTQIVGHGKDTGILDIGPWLATGRNLFLIRIYQTASPDTFTSAITGGIQLEYPGREPERILTDEAFESLWVATFWDREESKDFATNPSAGRLTTRLCTAMHPIALRRSCLFRKEFVLPEGRAIVNAVLETTGCGFYEASLNGMTPDDALFNPPSTEKRREFRCLEVTGLLRPGVNVLAAITGNGWYNCASWGTLRANRPAVRMALAVTFDDGSRQVVVTDESWKTALSPLVDNDLQFGERYDARMELHGWNCAGYSDEAPLWQNASQLPASESAAIPPLLEQSYAPIRPVARRKPALLGELPPGSFPAARPGTRAWIYDAGKELAGSFCLTLKHNRPGAVVGVFSAERLRRDGTPETAAYGAVVYPQDSLPDGMAPFNLRGYHQYIARGEALERYQPRFSYTGYRYVILCSDSYTPADVELEALEIHNDLTVNGAFHCGSEALNRIWDAVCQSWKNNIYNGPTDCPTREKNFWNGDAQIFAPTACWYMDNQAFLGTWTRFGRKMEPGPYAWEDETYDMPYTLYRFYGDARVLRDCYPAMLELIRKRTPGNGAVLPEVAGHNYCDWLNPFNRNLEPLFFVRLWHIHMLDKVGEIAAIVGDDARAKELRQLAAQGRAQFNALYFDAEHAEYSEKLQSALVLTLAFGIVPEEKRTAAAARLVEYIRREGSQSTGFPSTRYLPGVLSEYGYGEVMLELFLRREFPSWLNMLDTGATSITESWYGCADPDPSVSMSHFSLGAPASWFFEYLAGIRVWDSAPGFASVRLTPHAFPQLGTLDVSYRTPLGLLRVHWHYEDGKPVYAYDAPPGMAVDWRPEER